MQITDIVDVYQYKTARMSWETQAPRDCHILSFQVCGRYDHTVSGEVLPVCSGDVFFINRKDPYTVKCYEKGYALCVSFLGEVTMPTRVWNASDNPAVYNLFLRMQKIKNVKKKSNYYLALSIIYEIMSIIANSDEKLATQSIPKDKIEIAKEYIAENLRDGDVSASHLSEMCGVSEKHFRTLFKKRYGTTPAQYTIDLRMSYAARLLLEGNFAVSEVAEMVGINDVYYFSKIFKKRFSVSPSHFKKAD